MRDNDGRGCFWHLLALLACFIIYALIWKYVGNSDMPDWAKAAILS